MTSLHPDPLLEIANLDLRFRQFEGESHVLNGVNLTVRRGERVALVGESGCGKSVLARAVLGLLNQSNVRLEGRILFEGRAPSADLLGRRITMVFQDPVAALNPVFTIGDQLIEVIRRSGRGKHEARELARAGLRQVAIDDPDRVLSSYPFQLSGGMNQRVLITMALVNRPDLVIADEPGTSLDVTVQAQTLRLMRALTQEAGAAVLLIAHNLGVVRQFAERVYVMYAGTIVEEAPAADLFRAPRHPYTRALLASVPRLSGGGLPHPIKGMVPDYTRAPPGCRFAPRCPHARAACAKPVPRISFGEHHVACVLAADVPVDA